MNAPTQASVPLIDLDNLATLVAIADTGNFSAAAEVVFRTPSAISMQVKKMEETLGRPIFRREPRRVTLTLDGEQLVAHARRMLALNRDMVAKFITPAVAGEVRLGAPDDVSERFLPDMLRRFADSHCGVTVSVVVETSGRILEMMRNGKLDLGLITCNAGVPNSAAAEHVFEEQLVWATLRGGVAAEQTPLPVSVWEETCVWRRAAVDGLNAAGRDYRVTFQSAHISAQKAAILADLAVAPLPASSLGGQIVEAAPRCALPPLPSYALGLVVADGATPPVEAAADHLRVSFARRA